mmetsp:Transcript_24235/g.75564  ORF Transcript_24235/g.75564 Transcript_24235/m.75564 type:complete len:238 (-) Transcript_24235:565-1278(-)
MSLGPRSHVGGIACWLESTNVRASSSSGAPAPAATTAVACVRARCPLRSLDTLLDGLLVVALVPELALEVVSENLERLPEFLEALLGELFALGVIHVHLVGVQLKRAPLECCFYLWRRRHSGDLQEPVEVRSTHLAHLKVGTVVGMLDLCVMLIHFEHGCHVLEGLLVAAERVQGRGAGEGRGLALVVAPVERLGAILEALVVLLEAEVGRRALSVEHGVERRAERRICHVNGLGGQ